MLRRGIVAGALICSTSAAWADGHGDAEYGEYLAQECATCHKLEEADGGQIPPIFGLDQLAFVYALEDYRDGHRENQVMALVAKSLGEEEMWALAAYYGSLEPAESTEDATEAEEMEAAPE